MRLTDDSFAVPFLFWRLNNNRNHLLVRLLIFLFQNRKFLWTQIVRPQRAENQKNWSWSCCSQGSVSLMKSLMKAQHRRERTSLFLFFLKVVLDDFLQPSAVRFDKAFQLRVVQSADLIVVKLFVKLKRHKFVVLSPVAKLKARWNSWR